MKIEDMPQLIPSMDLASIEAGKDDCLTNVNSATVVQRYDENAALYELDLRTVGYYFVYVKNRPIERRIEYFVRFRTIDLDPSLSPAKAIRQVLLWRNRSIKSAYSANATRKIFWEHLFPKYKCLASDSQQTDDGQGFWSTAVGTALERGLTVRIINTNDKTSVDVATHKDFDAYMGTTWGTTKWFQRMIVVIFEEAGS